jgi:3-hydroxymyristoyl/3-hydroxydecanoyl-(acyl carrier protein) dehydratase
MSEAEPWLVFAPEHPAFSGHFPGAPIVPGALLLDEALHSLAARSPRWRIASVKFHRVVRPLEPLQLDCQAGPHGELRVSIHTRAELVMSATLGRPEP